MKNDALQVHQPGPGPEPLTHQIEHRPLRDGRDPARHLGEQADPDNPDDHHPRQ
jgi:hypothetical protein